MRLDQFDQYVLAALTGCAALPADVHGSILTPKGVADRALASAKIATGMVCAEAGHVFEKKRCVRCQYIHTIHEKP